MKFKGRYAGKVVNPNKPAKVGINAIVMADGVSKITLLYSTKGLGQTNKLFDNMNKYSCMVASMVHQQNYVKYVVTDNLYTTNPLQELFHEGDIIWCWHGEISKSSERIKACF